MLWIIGNALATGCNIYATWWMWKGLRGAYLQGHADGRKQGITEGALLTLEELKKYNRRAQDDPDIPIN